MNKLLSHDLEALVEGPCAKILVDERGRIALANGQAEEFFGYSQGELLGQSIEVLVPERFRRWHPQLRSAFHADAVARPVTGRALYGRRKDGREVPIEIGLDPIDTDAGNVTLVAIVDITKR